MTLNGMFSEPKPHRINFIKENKKKLKQISSMVNQNVKCSKVDLAKSQSSQTDVGRQLHSSSSKLNTNSSSGRLNRKSIISVFMQDKRNNDTGSATALFTSARSSHKSVSVTKNQSCQTIDPKNYDQLFHEGVIMYPSNKVLDEIAETERQKANRLDAHVKKDFFRKNRLKSKSPSKTVVKTNVEETKKEKDDSTKSEEEVKTQGNESVANTKVSITKVMSKPKMRDTSTKSEEEAKTQGNESVANTKVSVTKVMSKPKMRDTNPALNAAEIIRKTTEDHVKYSPRNYQTNQEHVKPSNRGDSNKPDIPKIVKKTLNKKNKREEDEVLKTVLDPMCPPGHIPLPDQERKKTLHMLRVSYAELIREMNLLPVRADTLRIRQRKIQLEKQLSKIEEGIKVFNKSKVYVKIEE